MPLASAEVDTTFTGVANAAAFMSTTTLVSPDAVITYANGVFSVGATPLDMDGTDNPVRPYGLTNAALETDTDSEDVVTYDDENKGFNVSLPTSKSWEVAIAGVADFKDAGYHILRLTERNTIADSLRVKFLRVGPTGTDEKVYGYGTLSGYTESIEAGSIASWEATLTGYGPYRLDLDTN